MLFVVAYSMSHHGPEDMQFRPTVYCVYGWDDNKENFNLTYSKRFNDPQWGIYGPLS